MQVNSFSWTLNKYLKYYHYINRFCDLEPILHKLIQNSNTGSPQQASSPYYDGRFMPSGAGELRLLDNGLCAIIAIIIADYSQPDSSAHSRNREEIPAASAPTRRARR